jgi:hypothetical protein
LSARSSSLACCSASSVSCGMPANALRLAVTMTEEVLHSGWQLLHSLDNLVNSIGCLEHLLGLELRLWPSPPLPSRAPWLAPLVSPARARLERTAAEYSTKRDGQLRRPSCPYPERRRTLASNPKDLCDRQLPRSPRCSQIPPRTPARKFWS